MAFITHKEIRVIRLDKYLTEMSAGTRSEVKRIIKSGRVTVNDETVLKAEVKIDEKNDIVMVDGNEIDYCIYEYFMFNKPMGCVSATRDNTHKTVIDFIIDSKKNDLFPVGRLDIDTEGLLIITNDGELAHNLLSPKKHVDKTYFLIADGLVTDDDLRALEEGVDIGDDKNTLPAKVENVKQYMFDGIDKHFDKNILEHIRDKAMNKNFLTSMELTIHEGRYHQVKRMLQAVGKPVLYLKRTGMGGLKLDEELLPGEYRHLTAKEISLFNT